MDQVHVKKLLQQLTAQNSQQRQHVTTQVLVLTQKMLVQHSQEHVQIILQQYKVDVKQNHNHVLKEHSLMEFIHVYLLLLHVLH